LPDADRFQSDLGVAEGLSGDGRADLVGDPAVFAEGFREAHQTVEAVRVLVGHDQGSDAGPACHESLGPQRSRASRTVLRLVP
jgi:hypothetical protein